MAIERLQIRLPDGFDPVQHGRALADVVAKKHGPGWEIESVAMESGIATLTRQSALVEVIDGNTDQKPDAFEIRLPGSVKLADGDKFAARQADANPGYHLIRFEPHLGRAVMGRMSEPEFHCREAIANVLGVKPWDVTCRQSRNKGFTLQLPIEGKGRYSPAKHEAKMQEVAEQIVGEFGWYFTVDTRTMVCQIVPSAPPTFPEMLRLDVKQLGKGDLHKTPFGLKLPGPGEAAHDQIAINWKDQAFALVSGLPGSGKSVLLNNLISDQLSNGAELIIVDDPAKSIDFVWAKPFVRDGGWGCDGLRSAVTALMLMYEEGQRRAAWMAEHGFVNWFDIPEKERFKPILAVVDEVAALLVTERLPPGVDKNLAEVQEIIEENRLRFKLQRRIQKVIAEQRFVGMRMILASQVTNQNTGLPPTLKSLIGHKMLQGTNPSKVQRDQAFNVSANVPFVPENLRGGGNVAKGVGAAELEAQPAAIYKSFFATTDDLSARLRHLGVRISPRPEPTEAEMDRLCPISEDDLDADTEPLVAGGGERLPSGKPLSSLPPEFGPQVSYGADGRRLRGAAAAQAAGATLAKQASRAAADDLPMCPSCDQPIQLNGDCGCSF